MHNHVFTERCKKCWSIRPTRGPCETCNQRAVASRGAVQAAVLGASRALENPGPAVPHCGVSLRYSAPIGTAVWVKTAGTWLMTKTASEPLEHAGRWWVTTMLNKNRAEACEDVFHVVKPGSVPHCGVSIRPDTAIGTRVWCEDNRGVWQATVTESLPYREGEAPWRVWLRHTWLVQTRHVFYVNAPPVPAVPAVPRDALAQKIRDGLAQTIRADLFPDGPIPMDTPTGSPVWCFSDYRWRGARTAAWPSFRPDGSGTVSLTLRNGNIVERPVEQVFLQRCYGVVASDVAVGTVVVCMDESSSTHLARTTSAVLPLLNSEVVFVEGPTDDRAPVLYPRKNVFYAHRSR